MEFQLALDAVYKGLEKVNAIRPPHEAISPGPEVVLVGEGGSLDSLEVVTLVLAIERRVFDITGQEVSLLGGDDFEEHLPALRNPSLLAQLIMAQSTT